MDNLAKLRCTNTKQHANVLRVKPIVAAISSLLCVAGSAYGQQAADVKVDTVVVTGLRYAIETSVAAKRNSGSIIESVSAEDIGKLPDVSIAESLARLPGLAGQRIDGRAQVIAIRGLSPDFAGTLLNGREMVTTGDNRGVEFDQFPSELINSATVYKTPDAGLLGQGLSGTVNMQTVRPLDIKDRTIVLNARGEKNSQGKLNANSSATGGRLSASYIDNFANHTIGVALGFAHLDSPSQTKKQQIWGWDLNGAAQATSWGLTPKNFPAQYLHSMIPGGDQIQASSTENKRDGLMAVVEFKPSKELHSTIDLYYSKFDQAENMRGLFWGQGVWDGGGPNNISNPGFSTLPDGTNVLTSGTVSGLKPVVRNDLNTRNDKITALGWNTELKLDKWTTTADLSYSKSDRRDTTIETYAGTGLADGSFNFNVPTNSLENARFIPGLNYADVATIKLGDPAGWGHDGRLQNSAQTDTMKAMRLQAKRDLDGIFSSVEAGFNYSTREKTRIFDVYFANLLNKRAPAVAGADILQAPTSLAFGGVPGVLSYDVMGALNKYYTLTHSVSSDDLKKDYSINEKVTTSFAKLGIDTELGKTPIRGNIGVQFVHTDQSSDAFNIHDNKVVGNVSNGITYNDVLPSLNLVADFSQGMLVRFGAAKTLARPRMDLMKASADAGVDATSKKWSGGGGNPTLQPWRANGLDLSFEKYFGKRSYVAVAVFHKKLVSWVSTKTVDFDFTGYTNTSNTVVPVSNIGTFSTPVNREGGTLKGTEFSLALEGNMLSPMLDGFGLLGSTSITSSNITDDLTNLKLSLPGLSKTVANATFYYEKNGFSARISERYRSEFRGEITGLFADRSYLRILPDRQTDFQMGYEFQSGAYKGMSLLLQVNNLTNSAYQNVQDGNFAGGTGGTQPREFSQYGRQVLFGLNYKL
jgi:iron complex outermembrane receptor protein